MIGTFPDKNGTLEDSKEDSRNQEGHYRGVDDKPSGNRNFHVETVSLCNDS
jgi:hypothetical protein